jgi:hypothetical protein
MAAAQRIRGRMNFENKISDLLIKSLPDQELPGGTLRTLLQFDDHLLRRFGRMDLIDLHPEGELEPVLRQAADEIWIIVRGEVEGFWKDQRPNSPTFGLHEKHRLQAHSLALLPFGVAFACRAGSAGCLLLRVMTHAFDPAGEASIIAREDLLED